MNCRGISRDIGFWDLGVNFGFFVFWLRDIVKLRLKSKDMVEEKVEDWEVVIR